MLGRLGCQPAQELGRVAKDLDVQGAPITFCSDRLASPTRRRGDHGGQTRPAFSVDMPPERDVVRVCPRGEIDMNTVGAARSQLDELAGADFMRVVLDLQGTTFLDSTGLRRSTRTPRPRRTAGSSGSSRGHPTCSGPVRSPASGSGSLRRSRRSPACAAEGRRVMITPLNPNPSAREPSGSRPRRRRVAMFDPDPRPRSPASRGAPAGS
jgi:hypothetical protein